MKPGDLGWEVVRLELNAAALQRVPIWHLDQRDYGVPPRSHSEGHQPRRFICAKIAPAVEVVAKVVVTAATKFGGVCLRTE